MRGVATLAVVVAGLAFVGGADAVSPSFTAARLSSADVRRMVGTSWHRGCPVALADLRLVTATYWGFDKRAHTGRIVVHRDVAADVLAVLRRLYAARFPIRRMVPVDAYGGSDYRSIEADNTSAFNCRYVDGTTRWSEHAYGRAIDLNPIENPYVTSSGTTSHPASRRYPPSRAVSPRHGGRGRRGRPRVRRRRLGLGRPLVGRTRLPALLGERSLSAKRSGRPGSNRRHSAWKADALPTELHPHGSSVAP